VVGGDLELEDLKSAEVIDLETSATTCDDFTSFPTTFKGGVGGLGFSDEPFTCQGMSFIFKFFS
jgi:hypothetical protein